MSGPLIGRGRKGCRRRSKRGRKKMWRGEEEEKSRHATCKCNLVSCNNRERGRKTTLSAFQSATCDWAVETAEGEFKCKSRVKSFRSLELGICLSFKLTFGCIAGSDFFGDSCPPAQADTPSAACCVISSDFYLYPLSHSTSVLLWPTSKQRLTQQVLQ